MKNEQKVIHEMSDPQNEIQKILSGFAAANETVTVWAGSHEDRNNFEPAINVNGKLEKGNDGQFRVLVSDGTYTYFYLLNIITMGVHPDRFQDGAKAVIKIEL